MNAQGLARWMRKYARERSPRTDMKVTSCRESCGLQIMLAFVLYERLPPSRGPVLVRYGNARWATEATRREWVGSTLQCHVGCKDVIQSTT